MANDFALNTDIVILLQQLKVAVAVVQQAAAGMHETRQKPLPLTPDLAMPRAIYPEFGR